MKKILIAIVSLNLVACASIKTHPVASMSKVKGIKYYLPLSDLMVRLEVTNQKNLIENRAKKMLYRADKNFALASRLTGEAKEVRLLMARADRQAYESLDRDKSKASTRNFIHSAHVGTTEIYPDIGQSYTLDLGDNYIAGVNAGISVTGNGLLKSAGAKVQKVQLADNNTETNTEQLFFNHRSSEQFRSDSIETNVKYSVSNQTDCMSKQGIYNFIIPLNSTPSGIATVIPICDNQVNVVITHQHDKAPTKDPSETNTTEDKSLSGVFYRQMVRYSVELQYSEPVSSQTCPIAGCSEREIVKRFTIYSPSGSSENFLPIKKTLFGQNDSSVHFDKGVLLGYSADSDGELVSFLTVPSEVISSYFSAIGSIYTGFSTLDSQRDEQLQNRLKYEFNRERYIDCLNALQRGDDLEITQLECSSLVGLSSN